MPSSRTAEPVCIPADSARGSFLSAPLTTPVGSCVADCGRPHLILLVSCFSVMRSDVECLLVSVGHSYVFFGEVPVRVFCPLLNWIIWVLGVELCKFFM